METSKCTPHAKVFYTPIEAAIRWSDLVRYEARILHAMDEKPDADVNNFPKWPILQLNLDRLYDAFHNGELPYGKTGITCKDPSLLSHPDLTVRHLDLRVWMTRYYPDEKPQFLFSGMERQLCSAISSDNLHALLLDREALQLRLAAMEKSFHALHEQYRLLSKQPEGTLTSDKALPPRSESTYLSIVGGLLTLLLGKSPSGKRYSSFDTTESIISALVAYYPGQPGISERTLWAKFGAAKRHIGSRPD